ncbi:MAG: GGDEF domain-containing protein, partial [Desulfovibrionales bacterium]|nr:GGDEF domain-containing protein [Desulfovibrionales bacterium]
LSDFELSRPQDVNYLNHDFKPDEPNLCMDISRLTHYELNGKNCRARLYMIPGQELTASHDKIINLLLQGCATALEKQIKIDSLRNAMVVDPLTQCYNRREFEAQLQRHMSTARRHGSKLSLFMFDLDHFKSVNDTHGHLGGDQVLKKVAALVQSSMRKGDILARYGGEEFIAILPETNKAKATDLANRLREKIAHCPVRHHQASIRVTASFGVAELSQGNDMAQFIEEADTMLYKAKLKGRNTVMPGVIRLCQSNSYIH